MSDCLGRLAQRVIAPEAFLQPRVGSIFESSHAARITEETVETIAPPRAASTDERASAVPVNEKRSTDGVTQPVEEPSRREPPREERPDEEPIERSERSIVMRETIESLVEEIAAEESRAQPAPGEPFTVPRVLTHRAATPFAASAPQQLPPTERDVHITIGRIDVRALTPPPLRERPAAKEPKALTLDEYLAKRSRR